MRILFLNHNPAGVGTWQRASNLGKALAARGHEVTLVTTHPSRRAGFEEVTAGSYTEIRAPDLLAGAGRTGWDPTNAARRVLRLRGRPFDLVHGFDCRPVVIGPALTVARSARAVLFLDWADWWGRGGRIQERSGWAVRTVFGPVETWFEEAFRLRAQGTTTVSRALAERARGLGVPPERIWTLPNGCDVDGIRPVERAFARRRVGVPRGVPLVVHVGVLTAADMAQLAGGFQRLRRHLPEARLVLVGNHKAPVPPALRADAQVRITGFVPSEALRDWLGAADVCVIPLTDTPNNRGRWPGRINDYLSAGRGTVMPRVGDAAGLLEGHGAGWICPSSAEGLARSLLTALRPGEERLEVERRARALAEGALAWPVLAERLEVAYNATFTRRADGGRGAGSRPYVSPHERAEPEPTIPSGPIDDISA